jgi:hypothetical protein
MDEDRTYYEDRAEAELACAQKSEDPAAVRAHYALAGYYLDLVYGDGTAEALISGASVAATPPVRPALLAQLRAVGVIILSQNPS